MPCPADIPPHSPTDSDQNPGPGELEGPTALRRLVYGLLIISSLAAICGRIATLAADRDKTPMLSANDRSRWCAVRALGDRGDYVIDRIIFWDTQQTIKRKPWHTIDLVRHRGWDGELHYYSSKPPLLPTLVAGVYWLLKQVTGAQISQRPFYVIRILLVIVQVVPLAGYFWLLSRGVERWANQDAARIGLVAAATWGTFVTTFAVTLNNHLPAAIAALASGYCTLRICRDGERAWKYFVVAGLSAAFAATCELPALSLLGLSGLVLLVRAPQRTLLGFAPAVLVVAAAFFGTNYAAHGSLRPPYMHRGDGPVLASIAPLPLAPGPLPEPLVAAARSAGLPLDGTLRQLSDSSRWALVDPQGQPLWSVTVGSEQLQIREWDNWYAYPGTYWSDDARQGIDRGETSRRRYAFHVLIGHHGIFSLTPLWLLSLAGGVIWLFDNSRRMRWAVLFVLVLSGVCLGFYLARPEIDRNYGGMTVGFRWMFWFTPLWLFCAIPAMERLTRRRWGRALILVLLGISVFSASYQCLNPWSQPWLYQYWQQLGWL